MPFLQKRFYFFSFLFACLYAANLSAQNDAPWVFKNEKDNVKVYYRKTSDFHEVKLAASIQSSLSGIIQLLGEVELYPKWGYKVVESKQLRKISETEMYYYSKIDFPWPLQDRDIIMHTSVEQDPTTRAIIATSKAVGDFIPEKKDIVRIKNAHTTWKIWPGQNGWAYVEYYIYSDPGGNIPDWMVNMAIDVGPRETIRRIREIVKQPKYQTAKLAHILD